MRTPTTEAHNKIYRQIYSVPCEEASSTMLRVFVGQVRETQLASGAVWPIIPPQTNQPQPDLGLVSKDKMGVKGALFMSPDCFPEQRKS